MQPTQQQSGITVGNQEIANHKNKENLQIREKPGRCTKSTLTATFWKQSQPWPQGGRQRAGRRAGRHRGLPCSGKLPCYFEKRPLSLITPLCFPATHQTPDGSPAVRKHCLCACSAPAECMEGAILDSCSFMGRELVRQQELWAGAMCCRNAQKHQTSPLCRKVDSSFNRYVFLGSSWALQNARNTQSVQITGGHCGVHQTSASWLGTLFLLCGGKSLPASCGGSWRLLWKSSTEKTEHPGHLCFDFWMRLNALSEKSFCSSGFTDLKL